MKSKEKKQNRKAIKRLAELLVDVKDSFGWYGIGLSTDEAGEVEQPGAAQVEEDDNEEEEEDEEDDEEETPQYYFDPADVQVAVDEAISTLMKEGLLPEFSRAKNAPKLSDIFSVLFGDRSEINGEIRYFEKLIRGYRDEAHIDDLNEAYGTLQSIIEKISPKKAKA